MKASSRTTTAKTTTSTTTTTTTTTANAPHDAGNARTKEVLAALSAAATAIRCWEWLRSPAGQWVALAVRRPTTSTTTSTTSATSTTSVPAELLAALKEAQHVNEHQYKAAIAIADELSTAMRAALQEGYVFVLPTTPGIAPKCSGKDWEKRVAEFRALSEKFAALSSLAGVPQVVMPMPSSTQKRPPLSISMVTLQRRDSFLVKAAAKLGPMLAEEAANLNASRQSSRGKTTQASTTTTTTTSGGTSTKKSTNTTSTASGSGKHTSSTSNGGGSTSHTHRPSGSGGTGSRRPPFTSADAARALKRVVGEEQHATAELLKEEGNKAFKAGRYEEAVKRYTEAAQHNPTNAVYYSNRAMAYLKLGRYTAAEAECDIALQLDVTSVKALLRRGSAQLAQGRLEEARADFQRVLSLEPQNRQALEEVRRLNAAGGGGDDDDENASSTSYFGFR